MSKSEIITPDKNEIVPQALNGFSFDSNDIDYPRLNIVQKTSDIEASTGCLVLDKKFLLLKPEEIADVVIVSAIKSWREDIPFDEQKMSRIAATPEAAQQLALDSSYPIQEFADIVMMFRQPEGSTDDEAYAYPIGDNNYALGKLYVSKHGYRNTYRRLTTFAKFNRTINLQNKLWKFQTQSMEQGKYSWYIPSLSVGQENTPKEVLEFIEMINA